MEIQYTTRTVIIPDKIEQISLSNYTKIVELVSNFKFEEDEGKKFLILLEIIEIFCSLTEAETDLFSIEEINDLGIKISEQIKNYNIE